MQRDRSLVLVAGSGRSGTSLVSGILQRLGYHVPAPEVPADDTNPRGFAESQWVVDFHTALLKRVRVQVSDARPAAWAITADVCLEEEVQQQLRTWLEQQYREADHVLIKDPRLSWFLPLWQRCAEAIGVSPRFVTMLRHPAAVVDSKQRSYGGLAGRRLARRGLAEPDAVHRAGDARRPARDGPLRRRARGLDEGDRPDRRGARPGDRARRPGGVAAHRARVRRPLAQPLALATGATSRSRRRCARRPTRRGR